MATKATKKGTTTKRATTRKDTRTLYQLRNDTDLFIMMESMQYDDNNATMWAARTLKHLKNDYPTMRHATLHAITADGAPRKVQGYYRKD